MEILQTVHVIVKSLFVLLLCSVCEGRESDYVTCGSLVKLLNTRHNVRLHSHDVKYGSGNFTITLYTSAVFLSHTVNMVSRLVTAAVTYRVEFVSPNLNPNFTEKSFNLKFNFLSISTHKPELAPDVTCRICRLRG